jgi:hypothetical protein
MIVDSQSEVPNPPVICMKKYFIEMSKPSIGMDVKSVCHLFKESQSLDIVRAMIREDHTVETTAQTKIQHEQKWTRKSAISLHAAEIAGIILSSTEPAIGNIAVVEPPLVIHDTQPQDLQPPQSP